MCHQQTLRVLVSIQAAYIRCLHFPVFRLRPSHMDQVEVNSAGIHSQLYTCFSSSASATERAKKKHFTTEKKKRKTRWPRVKLTPRCAHPYAHALPHYPGRCQATMDSCFSFGTPLGFAKPASSSVGYAMLTSCCPKRLKSAFFFKRCSIMLLLKITSYH